MEVIENIKLSEDFYLLKVRCSDRPEPGQFYMVRAWDLDPLLSRPLSVFDGDGKTLSFLYKPVGRGTERLTQLRSGDNLEILGPLGHGFPLVQGPSAIVGGGLGIAPLYYLAKRLKEENLGPVDVYLGFSATPVLGETFNRVSDRLRVQSGGYITDLVDTQTYANIFSCGPEIMMKVLCQKVEDEESRAQVYLSLEERMACGFGVCLACSLETRSGRQRVCKDGPVFKGEEVFHV